MTADPGLPVQATQTSVQIIETLLDHGGAGVTELAEELERSKSSVHNHLETLVGLGLVTKQQTEYRVSSRWVRIGSASYRSHPIYKAGVSEAIQLAEATGCDAGLAILDGDAVVSVYHRFASDVETPTHHAGEKLPLHCTAAGKAILAALPAACREGLLADADFDTGTDAAQTTPAAVAADVETVQTRGVALDRQEWQPEQAGIAAAITSTDDERPGAIYIRTGADTVGGKRFQQDLPGLVISSANRLQTAIRQTTS